MQLPVCEVERVFRKVLAVREHLAKRALEGAQNELSYETLADTIADMYRLDISIYVVEAAGNLVAGNVERYADGRAIILAKAQQSEPMLRLVIVKELCHLMIDEEDDWSVDGLATIREMKVEFDLARANGDGVVNPSRTQMSEYLAMISAVALMYPCEYHKGDSEKVAADEKSVARVALEHNMPGWAVELAFNHGDLFEIYEKISK